MKKLTSITLTGKATCLFPKVRISKAHFFARWIEAKPVAFIKTSLWFHNIVSLDNWQFGTIYIREVIKNYKRHQKDAL